MKRLVLFLCPLIYITSYSQVRTVNFNYIDDKVKSIPVAAPDLLARALTAPFTTELEKVRAIFVWVAKNIEYNARPLKNSSRITASHYLMDDPLDTAALKPLSERVALDVLSRGFAFCDGYSRLFKTLCDYAGIKSEIITGYGNGSDRKIGFKSNHRWNAVYIDSSWHLLDVTWASGYITFSGDFFQNFDDKYFLTPAKEFAKNHFPEDLRWSLLDQAQIIPEFDSSPFKTQSYLKNNVRAYSPQRGVIEAFVGDTLYFEIDAATLPKDKGDQEATFIDSDSTLAVLDTVTQQNISIGNQTLCKYPVASPNIQWLNLVYNNEVILRYKLNIKKSFVIAELGNQKYSPTEINKPLDPSVPKP